MRGGRKREDDFKVKFVSQIAIGFEQENCEDCDFDFYPNDELLIPAINLIAADWAQSEMEEYLPANLKEKIKRIFINVDLSITLKRLVTVVLCNSKLSDPEIFETAQWLSGQFSDGFGEGFEQTEFSPSMFGNPPGISFVTIKMWFPEQWELNLIENYKEECNED